MSAQPQPVKPGDLITAESWNELVGTLSSFEVRLAILEATSTPLAPVLIRREPLGDVEVGSLVTLIGKNFAQPTEQNTVTLGSAQITHFSAGSDDEHLVFEVPDVFTGLPVSLPLAVHTVHGDSGTIIVRVLAHVEPQGGEVVFTSRTAPGQSPLPGQTLTLEWDVDSQTLLPESYALSAVWVNAVGVSQAAWAQATTIVPATATTITRGHPQRATLTVVVPAGGQSIDVTLKATAQDHADLTKTSGPVHVQVGQPLPTSDPRTPMTLKEPPPLTDANPPVANPARAATIDGTSGIEVQRGQEGLLFVATSFTVAGKYAFSTQVEQGGAAWESRIQPATATQAAGTSVQIAVHVRNAESAAGPVRFMAVRAAKRNAADTADEFVSFVRFPVRGFAP